MVIEKKFVGENMRKAQIETFLSKEFARAGYSHVDIARTPAAMRITVWAQKPGMIIGRGGKTIDALTESLKTKFGVENPQLDVKEVESPFLDGHIVAQQIAESIERGLNYKRVVQFIIEKSMSSGAIGIAVRLGGKISGEMSRTEKFNSGYLKYAGDPAERLSKGYATANLKLGTIGIQVRIMTERPKEFEAMEKLEKMEKTEQ